MEKPPLPPEDSPPPAMYEVVVVGAGIAGLAATQSLVKNGCSSIALLEARDRIGGRILTQELQDIPLDLGASWIRGTNDNPLNNIPFRLQGLENVVIFDKNNNKIDQATSVQLIEKVWAARQRMVDSRKRVASALSEILSPIGGKLNHQNVQTILKSEDAETDDVTSSSPPTPFGSQRKRKSWWDRVRRDIDEAAVHSTRYQDTNIEDIEEGDAEALKADISIRDWLESDLEFCNEISKDPKHGHLLLDLANMLENLEGADLNVISLANHDKNDFSGPHLYVSDGLWDLVRITAGGILSEDIDILKLNHEVLEIDYSGEAHSEFPVLVHTTQGAYLCKTVIVTLPVGILQARHHEIFYPCLPVQHQTALSTVGVGLIDKIILEFPHCFWPPDLDGFWSFLPAPGIRRGMDFDEGEESPGLVWFVNIEKMHRYRREDDVGGPPVLIGHVSQRHARRIEEMDDEETENVIMDMLQKCFRGRTIPPLLSFRVTRWGMDPYSMGACTYLPVGNSASLASIITLSEPISFPETTITDGRSPAIQALHFAGEHTSPHHFGTVHGALMSGIVEAENVALELGLLVEKPTPG